MEKKTPTTKAKRGRPSAERVNILIEEGENILDDYLKCPFCHRIFPRDKSLNAHIKTHTRKFFLIKLRFISCHDSSLSSQTVPCSRVWLELLKLNQNKAAVAQVELHFLKKSHWV